MTPYRSAGAASISRKVLCPSCATEIAARDEGELTCPGCGERTMVERDDLALRGELALNSITEGDYDELAELAAPFGEKRKCVSLGLLCDGLFCSLTLRISSGTVIGLTYTAQTRGLPHVTFHKEDDDDRRAKERKIAREVQTGDEAFDAAVYIESAAADRDVLAVLQSPAVRAAIVAALEHAFEISVDAGHVYFHDRDTPACFEKTRVRRLLTALRVIAGAARASDPVPEVPMSAARLAVATLYLALPLGVGLTILGGSSYPPVDAGNLVMGGVVLAAIVAIVIQPLLTRILRGRSTSHGELARIRLASIVGVPVLGIGLALALNGAFDSSQEWREDGVVISASGADEDGRVKVVVRTPNRMASFSVYVGQSSVKPGDGGTLWLRRGAFGQAWKTRDSEVTRPR